MSKETINRYQKDRVRKTEREATEFNWNNALRVREDYI